MRGFQTRMGRKRARLLQLRVGNNAVSGALTSSQIVIYSPCVINSSSLRVFVSLRLRFTASTRGSGYSWTDTSCLTFITKWNLCPRSTRYGYRETSRSPSWVNPSLLFLCTPRTNKGPRSRDDRAVIHNPSCNTAAAGAPGRKVQLFCHFPFTSPHSFPSVVALTWRCIEGERPLIFHIFLTPPPPSVLSDQGFLLLAHVFLLRRRQITRRTKGSYSGKYIWHFSAKIKENQWK